MKTAQSEVYLRGIRQGNSKVIRTIYQHYGKAIVHLVETNGGSREDARDVLQEGVMLICQKAKDPNFEIKNKFLTYFYAVCRNIWLNKLRNKRLKEVTFDHQMLSMVEVEDIPNTEIEQNQQYHLYRKKFLSLGKDCQKVLSLFLKKVSMEDIMKEMGYSSINYTKKRKFMCKKKLTQLIREDPNYRKIE